MPRENAPPDFKRRETEFWRTWFITVMSFLYAAPPKRGLSASPPKRYLSAFPPKRALFNRYILAANASHRLNLS
jgi:hypothetical protein